MANGFPAVAFGGLAAAARVGVAVLPGAVAGPIGLGIIAGLAGVIGLRLLYDWYTAAVPFSGTWYVWSPSEQEWVPYSLGQEASYIFPGDIGSAYESVESFSDFPFTVTDFQVLTPPIPLGSVATMRQSGYTLYLPPGWGQCPTPTDCCASLGNITSTQLEYYNSGCATVGCCPLQLPGGSVAVPHPGGDRMCMVDVMVTGHVSWHEQAQFATAGAATQNVPRASSTGVPYFPTTGEAMDAERPWDLPIKGFGGVRNPPFPIPGSGVRGEGLHEPSARPVAPVNPAFPVVGNPAVPGSIAEPIISITFPVVSVPGTVVLQEPPPGGNPKPPEKGRKEVKLKGKIAVGIKFIANQVTEFRDFVRALWKALPKERRKCKRRCTLQQMIRDLADNVDYMWGNEAWVKEALVQVISNEIQDNFYGAGGRAFRNAAQKLRDQGLWGDVKGFQTGEGYRPKAKQTDTVFDLEVNVRRLVNLIW